MESYAIVQASGKQFWVEENKFYDFDKLPLDRGDTFSLNQILLVKLFPIGAPPCRRHAAGVRDFFFSFD